LSRVLTSVYIFRSIRDRRSIYHVDAKMGVKGKYFVIISKHSGLALDIKGGQAHAGAEVCMWDKHGRDNQCWFQEPVTGTIRSKMNPDLCLDLNGNNRLYMNHYQPGDANQQWQFDKHRDVFENRSNRNRVLDIVGNSKDKGAEVCAWDHHGRDNQRWKLDYLPARYFFIKSELGGKVLDIERGSGASGTKVITYHQKPGHPDNQLWFEDRFGNIRSKLNEDNVLDASDGTLRANRYEEGKNRTFWAVQGNKIVNVHNHGEVLDIKGNNASECAEICAWNYHGGANQHWHFEYV